MSTLLSGCQTPAPEIKANLSETTLANIALQSGDMRSAIALYQKILLSAEQQVNEDKDYTESTAETADRVHILLSLGLAYRAIEQNELAVHYLKKVTEQSEKNLAAWRQLGLNYLDQQDYKAAEQAFSHAIAINAFDSTSLNGLGVSYSWLQSYQAAHQYLMQALALSPGSLEFKNNLALNYILREQYLAAIKLLLPLYQQQRSSEKMRNNLAFALTLNGNEKQAKRVLANDYNQEQIEQNIKYYLQFSHTSKLDLTTRQDLG
ncbi:tetratricopeptide repeat protein [Colwellia psychrerythraea]|nr:tetratricopeptide repeat protein [Colwellia psychrerythraea]